MKIHYRWLLPFAAVVLTLTVSRVKATPYACEVTNNNGTIQFYLGEAADSVTVNFDNDTVTTNLGALPAGKNSFALNSHTNFAIVVSKNGSGMWHQISVDATNNSFYGPRGIAVNQDAQNSYFGRVYVVNASAGTGTPAPSQAVTRGLYVLNADTTYVASQGATAKDPSGMTFGVSTTYSPYGVAVGTDDVVYVANSDSPDVSGSTYLNGSGVLWMCDPNIGTATVLFQTNAAIGADAAVQGRPCVVGSYAAGNLQVYANMWGYGVTNPGSANAPLYTYIYDFNIGGSSLPYLSAPETNAVIGGSALDGVDGIAGDLAIAPDGKFYAAQDRTSALGGEASGSVSLWVYASDGVTYLWDSSTANGGVDPFSSTLGVAVSPDDKYVACINGSTGNVELAKLTNGIPDISTVVTNAAVGGGTARGIAFDAADNVYVTSGGNDRVRVFSLGLSTTTTTYNDTTGTNGTYNFSVPPTSVSVVAITNQASQSGPTPGVFQITRAGQNLNLPLTVTFVFSGTATNGVYTVSPAGITPDATNTITLAANALSTNVTIIPVNDGVSRPTTTVILSLMGGSTYTVGTPAADTVDIQNTGPQLVFVSGVGAPSMYKAFSNDYASFTVTRWGNTNVAAYPISFTTTGTAVSGQDYTAPTLMINPGDINDTVYVSPLIAGQLPIDTNNLPYTGNETIIVSVANGGGYTGATNNVTLTLVDNQNPPAVVLYEDPLTNSAPTNWNTTAASSDMVTGTPVDYFTDFGYDLYNDSRDADGVPIPYPPNEYTDALRLTVNKTTDATTTPNSAVNVYPTNLVLNGNFAVRFSMNLDQGSVGGQTEGPLFGINCNGKMTNWWTGENITGVDYQWGADGIWCWINADGNANFINGSGDYVVLTGNGGKLPNTGWAYPAVTQFNRSVVASEFKTNVFTSTAGPGIPANGSPDNFYNINSWADVEIKQFNNVVTFSIDKTQICIYTNTTSFTNGTVLLGYQEAYDGYSGEDAAVYYSDLKVVQLTPPAIVGSGYSAVPTPTYTFDFTSPDGTATTSSFKVTGTTSLAPPVTFTPVTGAAITQLPDGTYQATVPIGSKPVQFFRIEQVL
ncbi:MAG TPA: hypothetical protein VMF08_02255 [Candidatus Sulfotelmatobacter sp.]|nr:hypothetical protein [Candidatus Sulfotelmatobacter sp.]